ncbi:MAG TPA: hypothetical protein VM782_17185, partial [Stellaceae bacterium]|nr:hypothetical protein [Stellaceae bacterium]
MPSPVPHPADQTDERFDLRTSYGDGGFKIVMKFEDHGVSLSGDSLVWTTEGRRLLASLSDIVSVHLFTGAKALQGPMGSTLCQIRFKNGLALTVLSTNERGFPDDKAMTRYRAFVEALHRRLSPEQCHQIQFVAGYGSARYVTLLVLTAIWSLFILGGVAALFIGQEFTIRALIALVVGGSMLAAMVRLLQTNSPHAYDPSDPLDSAETGSIGGTIAHAFYEFRRTLTPGGKGIIAACGLALVVLAVLGVGTQQSANLFEPGRAQHAYEQVLATEFQRKVTKVEVTPEKLLVQFPNGSSSSRIEWTASRGSLFGWSEWDRLSGPHENYSVSVGEEAMNDRFDARAEDAAHLSELAQAAIPRAGLGTGSTVTQMVLTKAPDFAYPEPPRWTVRISSNVSRPAEVLADRNGQLYPATPEPSGPSRIVIRAIRGDAFGLFPDSGTWIRIINPDRSVRFDDTLKIGDSYKVPDVTGII